jgi:hypothetical protein
MPYICANITRSHGFESRGGRFPITGLNAASGHRGEKGTVASQRNIWWPRSGTFWADNAQIHSHVSAHTTRFSLPSPHRVRRMAEAAAVCCVLLRSCRGDSRQPPTTQSPPIRGILPVRVCVDTRSIEHPRAPHDPGMPGGTGPVRVCVETRSITTTSACDLSLKRFLRASKT